MNIKIYEILVDDHINVYLSIFRAQIISKKISVRFFENQKYHELKLKFYGYMIEVIIDVQFFTSMLLQ